ncbi:hypothetical protein MKZ38_010411 [Zalerion maritima]|uniref:Uncharacterized protein n=1 Tax=Zalerion maritima TaxID=339359 RepID=A0AAD5WU84_9PEZI|nr:hypothetical protein MKZ38_010411 [Zalerion maritima]
MMFGLKTLLLFIAAIGTCPMSVSTLPNFPAEPLHRHHARFPIPEPQLRATTKDAKQYHGGSCGFADHYGYCCYLDDMKGVEPQHFYDGIEYLRGFANAKARLSPEKCYRISFFFFLFFFLFCFQVFGIYLKKNELHPSFGEVAGAAEKAFRICYARPEATRLGFTSVYGISIENTDKGSWTVSFERDTSKC